MGGNKKYNKVQCIGMYVNTSIHNNVYSGIYDIEEDWIKRAEILMVKIREACNLREIDRSHDCLKIFSVPEFYFRSVNGAYDMETGTNIVEYLRRAVSGREYADWLFVFGTIMCYSSKDSRKLDKSDKLPKHNNKRAKLSLQEDLEEFFSHSSFKDINRMFKFYLGKRPNTIYNFAFVQKGNSGEEASYIVMKDCMSDSDLLDNIRDIQAVANSKNLQALELYESEHMTHARVLYPRSEEKLWNYDGHSIFEVDGLRIGLEICYDNTIDRIDRTRNNKNRPLDVHLIVSSGVEEHKVPRNLSKKGISFCCDGFIDIMEEEPFINATDCNGNKIECLYQSDLVHKRNDMLKKLFSEERLVVKVFKSHEISINKELCLNK